MLHYNCNWVMSKSIKLVVIIGTIVYNLVSTESVLLTVQHFGPLLLIFFHDPLLSMYTLIPETTQGGGHAHVYTPASVASCALLYCSAPQCT